MEEPKGHYEKSGDIEEWVWDGEGPGAPTLTGGWVVPEGEFDPTSAPAPEVSPAERPPEHPSPGLHVAAETTEEAEVEEETEEEDDLETYTKEEIQDMLAERGLPTSGNKPELIERLRA
jgi:hypothetical protein